MKLDTKWLMYSYRDFYPDQATIQKKIEVSQTHDKGIKVA